MDRLFLVKNVEDGYDNGTILSICSSEKAAEKMYDVVRNNFKIIDKDATDFIIIEELELSSNFEILWDLNPDDKEKGFTYAK